MRYEPFHFCRLIADGDNGNGDAGIMAGEVRPLEARVGEVDDVAGFENERPENGYLLALADRVGRDERSGRWGLRAEVGGFHEPARYVIDRLPTFGAAVEDPFPVGLLFVGLPRRSEIRWISADIRLPALVFEIDAGGRGPGSAAVPVGF